jgi:hypothetical protein
MDEKKRLVTVRDEDGRVHDVLSAYVSHVAEGWIKDALLYGRGPLAETFGDRYSEGELSISELLDG